MSKREKALERLRQNPKNVRFEELENILLGLGFEKKQRSTSHAVFRLGKRMITVPVRKPFVKAPYVKEVLKVIDELEENED